MQVKMSETVEEHLPRAGLIDDIVLDHILFLIVSKLTLRLIILHFVNVTT